MFLITIDVLESAGYRQYEISNYAKPGCECRHNLIYWRNQPYIGVGPSAAGCSNEATKRRSDEATKVVKQERKVEKSKVEKSSVQSESPKMQQDPSAGGRGGTRMCRM
jgi:coproporphyrinogen III oxidase-like Fe-S oxidoreductase